MRISFTMNGRRTTADVKVSILLVQLIRDQLGLTGTKIGCETTVCGACTVLLDGEPVKSCSILAVRADGHEITTIEGLSADGLTAIQRGFKAEHALQCGFCTPGMVVSTTALLARTTDPSKEAITEALEGNLCRCTGYVSIMRGVEHAAAILRGETPASRAGVDITTPVEKVEIDMLDIEASDVEVV